MKRDYTEQELKDFEIEESKKAEMAKLIEGGGTVKVTQTFNLDKKSNCKSGLRTCIYFKFKAISRA